MASGCLHGFEVQGVSGAWLKDGDIVVAPASVTGEQPAATEYGWVKMKPARQAVFGVSECAPSILEAGVVEEVELALAGAGNAAEIYFAAVDGGLRPVEFRGRAAECAGE